MTSSPRILAARDAGRRIDRFDRHGQINGRSAVPRARHRRLRRRCRSSPALRRAAGSRTSNAHFPARLTDGKVDRAKLSARLLAEPQRLQTLEAIVHPLIREAERALPSGRARRGARWPCSKCRCCSRPAAIAPSMSGSSSAPRATSSANACLQRPGMTDAKFETVVARQIPEPEKRARADFVVDTSGTVENCNSQIDTIITKLQRSGATLTTFLARLIDGRGKGS